jgi:hypothetical protein
VESIRKHRLAYAERHAPQLARVLRLVEDSTWWIANRDTPLDELRWPAPDQVVRAAAEPGALSPLRSGAELRRPPHDGDHNAAINIRNRGLGRSPWALTSPMSGVVQEAAWLLLSRSVTCFTESSGLKNPDFAPSNQQADSPLSIGHFFKRSA